MTPLRWSRPPGVILCCGRIGSSKGVHFFPMFPRMPWPIRPCPLISLPKDAHPLGFLLAIELPREIGPEWLEPFARGLDEHSERGGGP